MATIDSRASARNSSAIAKVTVATHARAHAGPAARSEQSTQPTRPVSAPMPNAVRHDAVSMIHISVAATSPLAAKAAGTCGGAAVLNRVFSAVNTCGAITAKMPAMANSRPSLPRSTPGTSPATVPEAVSTVPASAPSAEEFVAQLPLNVHADGAYSGARQKLARQARERAPDPSRVPAIPAIPASSKASARPQPTGFHTYSAALTSRCTVSAMSTGGSPAASAAAGGVTARVADCGTADSADDVNTSVTTVMACGGPSGDWPPTAAQSGAGAPS